VLLFSFPPLPLGEGDFFFPGKMSDSCFFFSPQKLAEAFSLSFPNSKDRSEIFSLKWFTRRLPFLPLVARPCLPFSLLFEEASFLGLFLRFPLPLLSVSEGVGPFLLGIFPFPGR